MVELGAHSIGELLQFSLQQGKRPFVTVVSNSMAPLLRYGDQIRLAPASADELTPGDIVVIRGPVDLITHRYWGCLDKAGRRQLITRGDRPQNLDSPLPASSLIGRVNARRRRGRILLLTNGAGRLLNRHLAWLARLEIFIFAHPIVITDQTVASVPRTTGLLHREGKPGPHVRVLRGMLHGWAVLVCGCLGAIGSAASRGVDDAIEE